MFRAVAEQGVGDEVGLVDGTPTDLALTIGARA